MSYDLRSLFKKIDRLLSENPWLRLAELEEEMGVERHTIERAVRSVKKNSFHSLKKRHQLNKSLALLSENGDWTVGQIAVAVGYQHATHFSRFIKNATGKTPIEHRNTHEKR